MTHTLSVAVLDDLRFKFKENVTFTTREELITCLKRYYKKIRVEYDELYMEDELDERHVESNTDTLLERGYLCWNRVQKYYVLCFAIDYKKFRVWSNDCDAEIIEWDVDVGDDESVAEPPEEHDINPVVKMVGMLLGKK
jgi:hypothetical protein